MQLQIHYNATTEIFDIHNNGHTIKYDFEAGDSISYQNKTYHLKQIHFHEPAEHTINGIRYPIEIHLVHANEDDFTVLSIMGREGKGSRTFNFLEKFLPIKIGESKEIHRPFDLRWMLPKETENFYAYRGSLTTPSCTEKVNWIIFRRPIILSLEQALILKELMPLNNYRNEQSLNDRIISRTF